MTRARVSTDYPWYMNPEHDGGRWLHWNHRILGHWDAAISSKFIKDVNFVPPEDIGANFYPELGPYSSRDPKVIDAHMEALKEYVVVVSWWGRPSRKDSSDGEGCVTDLVMPMLLESAERHGAKIAIHLEPYASRTAKSVKEDLVYITEKYGGSPALFRDPEREDRIVVYVYDSYHIKSNEWATILSPDGRNTIRGTNHDAVVFGLLLGEGDFGELSKAGFDGIYTYFAADGFTSGSTRQKWKTMTNIASSMNLLVSISVGPGYIDTRIRPWNGANAKMRRGGEYFEEGFRLALAAKPDYLSITSFNEWHEGSQIEAAIPKSIPMSILANPPKHDQGDALAGGRGFRYMDYEGKPPDHYLQLTKKWALTFEEMMK